MPKHIGLDLGTAHTRICVRGEEGIRRTPSAISVKKETGEILAVGADAKQMIGRTPHSVSAIRPVRGGVVDDIEHASLLVGALFDRLGATSVFRRPVVTAAIPYGCTETEKRALEDAVFEAGASAVSLIDAPIAAATGAGMRIAGTGGGMIVDIGAGRTEIAIVSHGGVIVSGSLPVAGDAFGDAIIRYLAEEQHILIGENTAELIKHKIGTLDPRGDAASLSISGKSTQMGGALTVTVTGGMLREAMTPLADRLATTVRKVMESTPPELASSLSDFGILMTGGSALLSGLPEYMGDALGVRVARSRSPITDVAAGILQLMENGELRRYVSSRAR